jgi:hypothetical protein
MPLGLLMVSEGWISETDLKTALEAQRTGEGGRIGDLMCRQGVATEQQITSALSMQWSRPVFSLEGTNRFLQCSSMIPLPLLEAYQMVPVHHLPQSRLYVAFSLGIDYSVLYGVEQMLGCRTEPCLAAETSVRAALEKVRQLPRSDEIVLDNDLNHREMAEVVMNYARNLNAAEARLVRCDRFLWVRLVSPQKTIHLLTAHTL